MHPHSLSNQSQRRKSHTSRYDEESFSKPYSEDYSYVYDEAEDNVYDEAKGTVDDFEEQGQGDQGEKGSKSKGGLLGCIQSIWRTRDTQTNLTPDMIVRSTLREFIIYIIFLVIISVITFGMVSSTMFYFYSMVEKLFLDMTSEHSGSFRDVATVDDFWAFIRGPLISGLYRNRWYNHKDLPKDLLGYVNYENKLLGLPRLRQLLVHSNSCTVHPDFKEIISKCYSPYKDDIEDEKAFETLGYKLQDTSNLTAWYYKSEKELDGSSHWGYVATYSGAGYIQNMGKTRRTSLAIIEKMSANRWINRGTRAVFIDFTLYNANINLFSVIRLLMEFPPTGGVIPSWTINTVKLIRYVTTGDYFVMACEILFVLFIIYYSIEEIIEISNQRWSYFTSGFWNLLDLMIIIISFICIGFSIYRTVVVKEKLDYLLDNQEVYADFERLGYWEMRFVNAIAITVFMAWIKIFKYISFNKTMSQLSSTLGRCASDLAGFAIMFFIVFIAFTILAYLLFGTMVKDFSTFQTCFFTLFRIILGDFDFEALEAANRVLGPLFFIMYVFFVFFVLINMFLAIINDTYSEVKEDMSKSANSFHMTDFFKERANRLMLKMHLAADLLEDKTKVPKIRVLNYDEWKAYLKSCGYEDKEIELMFIKHNYDGIRPIDHEEQELIEEELAKQKAEAEENASHSEESGGSVEGVGHNMGGVTYDDLVILSRRVDRIENTILTQLEAIITRLGAINKNKHRHSKGSSLLGDDRSRGRSVPSMNSRFSSRSRSSQMMGDEGVRDRSGSNINSQAGEFGNKNLVTVDKRTRFRSSKSQLI